MSPTKSNDPTRKRTDNYPQWLDNLAEDVTLEAPAMSGTAHGAETVRSIVVQARTLYVFQDFNFTGNYGDNRFLEDYTSEVHGEPLKVIVTIIRNAAGEAQHALVNHRPRSSMLLFSRLMHRKFSGTPLAEYFLANES